jgi:hypothetical protein
VLERAGYTLYEIDHILGKGSYLVELSTFRDDLSEFESVGAIARRIFDRYGFVGDTAEALLHTIQSVYDSTTITCGDLIQFI